MSLNSRINTVTAKKLFRHIVDSNSHLLTPQLQQRRLTELSNRISNKMEFIESQTQQLNKMINELKALEKSVQSQTNLSNSQTNLLVNGERESRANLEIARELKKLETMFSLLSRNPRADLRHLANLSERIKLAKSKLIR